MAVLSALLKDSDRNVIQCLLANGSRQIRFILSVKPI